MASKRQIFVEPQGQNEEVIYRFKTLPWGGTPTNISVEAILVSDGTDKTTAVFPTNSPSVVDTHTISLSPAKGSGMTIGERYRINVLFTAGGNVWELYGLVDAEA